MFLILIVIIKVEVKKSIILYFRVISTFFLKS